MLTSRILKTSEFFMLQFMLVMSEQFTFTLEVWNKGSKLLGIDLAVDN